MVTCITNKHTVLTSVCQLAAQFLHIMHNGNISKNMERVKKHWVLLVALAEGQILIHLGIQILHLGHGVCTFGPQSLLKVFMLSGEAS